MIKMASSWILEESEPTQSRSYCKELCSRSGGETRKAELMIPQEPTRRSTSSSGPLQPSTVTKQHLRDSLGDSSRMASFAWPTDTLFFSQPESIEEESSPFTSTSRWCLLLEIPFLSKLIHRPTSINYIKLFFSSLSSCLFSLLLRFSSPSCPSTSGPLLVDTLSADPPGPP